MPSTISLSAEWHRIHGILPTAYSGGSSCSPDGMSRLTSRSSLHELTVHIRKTPHPSTALYTQSSLWCSCTPDGMCKLGNHVQCLLHGLHVLICGDVQLIHRLIHRCVCILARPKWAPKGLQETHQLVGFVLLCCIERPASRRLPCGRKPSQELPLQSAEWTGIIPQLTPKASATLLQSAGRERAIGAQ